MEINFSLNSKAINQHIKPLVKLANGTHISVFSQGSLIHAIVSLWDGVAMAHTELTDIPGNTINFCFTIPVKVIKRLIRMTDTRNDSYMEFKLSDFKAYQTWITRPETVRLIAHVSNTPVALLRSDIPPDILAVQRWVSSNETTKILMWVDRKHWIATLEHCAGDVSNDDLRRTSANIVDVHHEYDSNTLVLSNGINQFFIGAYRETSDGSDYDFGTYDANVILNVLKSMCCKFIYVGYDGNRNLIITEYAERHSAIIQMFNSLTKVVDKDK